MRSFAIIVLAILVASSLQAPVRRAGMSRGQRNVLKAVLKAGISLTAHCAKAELKSGRMGKVLKKLRISPDAVVAAIKKLADAAVDKFIRRRLNVWTSMKNKFVGTVEAMKNAAKTYVKGAREVGNKMKGVYKKLDKLTGGRLTDAIANKGCPALSKAIEAGIAAQFAGVRLPRCVVSWFIGQCKKAVKKALTRHRLMRRLASIQREIMNY